MARFSTLLTLLSLLLATLGRAETVRLYHIGVGQGDGTLIVVTNNLGQKASVLIDAGNGSSKGTAVVGMLNSVLGDVKRVDVLITSHLHSDHLGGMPTVVQALQANKWGIGVVLDRAAQGYLGDDSCYTEQATTLIDRLNDSTPQLPSSQLVKTYSSIVKPLYQDNKLLWLNVAAGIEVFSTFVPQFATSAKLRCLTSNGYVCKTTADYGDWLSLGSSARNENDYSYSFLFELHSFKYFTGGDIGGGAPYVDLETPLVKFFKTRPDGGNFHFCAYKASHHGSLHSTNPTFVGYTKPTLTVVPSALRSFSGTKLPSETTLQGLDGVNSRLYYTYIWSASGSSRSSGTVTSYQDVLLVVHDTTYEASHQMRVCVAPRSKDKLELGSATCTTVTCTQHGSAVSMMRAAPAPDEAAREAFIRSVSVPLPGETRPPAPGGAPAATPTARWHRHFWPWRWGHRHPSAAEPIPVP